MNKQERQGDIGGHRRSDPSYPPAELAGGPQAEGGEQSVPPRRHQRPRIAKTKTRLRARVQARITARTPRKRIVNRRAHVRDRQNADNTSTRGQHHPRLLPHDAKGSTIGNSAVRSSIRA